MLKVRKENFVIILWDTWSSPALLSLVTSYLTEKTPSMALSVQFSHFLCCFMVGLKTMWAWAWKRNPHWIITSRKQHFSKQLVIKKTRHFARNQRESLFTNEVSFHLYLVFRWHNFNKPCKLFSKCVWCFHGGDSLRLVDVNIHLRTDGVKDERSHRYSEKHAFRPSHLEVRDQPPRLQEQRVLVEAQFPFHHLLVMKLELDVAARRNVDLRLKGLQVLGVSPVKKKSTLIACSCASAWSSTPDSGSAPDDARCFVSGSGLSVQFPGHGLLLHRAHERDAVHVPATGKRGSNRARSVWWDGRSWEEAGLTWWSLRWRRVWGSARWRRCSEPWSLSWPLSSWRWRERSGTWCGSPSCSSWLWCRLHWRPGRTVRRAQVKPFCCLHNKVSKTRDPVGKNRNTADEEAHLSL